MSETQSYKNECAGDVGVEIRHMMSADAQQVFELAQKCGLSFWSKADYEKETEREDSFAAVSELRGKINGFIIMRLITSLVKHHPAKYPAKYPKNIKFELKKDPHNKHKQHNSLDNNPVFDTVEAEIYNIAVSKDCRENGIGANLLQNAFRYILDKSEGVSATVWLEVRKSNQTAINFYLGNFFEISCERKNFYSNPSENALVLKTRIKAAGNAHDTADKLA